MFEPDCPGCRLILDCYEHELAELTIPEGSCPHATAGLEWMIATKAGGSVYGEYLERVRERELARDAIDAEQDLAL